VLNTGAVYCWGDNSSGLMGNASAKPGNNNVPVPVQGLPAAATSVAIGVFHACASLSTGQVACWGTNDEPYVLGNGAIPVGARSLPTLVPNVVRAVSVTASYDSSCALVSGLAIIGQPVPHGPQCWGDNSAGEAGQPTQNTEIPPTDDKSISWDITSITKGGNLFTCVISTRNGAMCFGADSLGSLGDNYYCYQVSANGNCYLQDYVNFNSTAGTTPTSISAGFGTACAVYANGMWGAGSVYCWGDNTDAQAGLPPSNFSVAPGAIGIQVETPATAVSVGLVHTCALVNSGNNIQCWGNGTAWGQLGNGAYTESYTPVQVL
jgi:alpha-tubulin suppressor-like RCC1 family protein